MIQMENFAVANLVLHDKMYAEEQFKTNQKPQFIAWLSLQI